VNIVSVVDRLLAWATDIEAQLGLQRQELRRSRIELASAQEVLKQPQPKCKVAHVTAMLNIIWAYFDCGDVFAYTAAFTVAHFCHRMQQPAMAMQGCSILQTSVNV